MIDEDGKHHATEAPPAIPPHMLDGLTSAAQKAVFGKTPKAVERTIEKAAEKAEPVKATRK